jgi:ABC-type Fe3+ transport system permease subunit
VAIIVTVFSVLIGVFFAFIVARYDFPGKRIIRTVLIFPMLATPFVGAIGIKYFMGRAGFINNLFYTTLHVIPFRIELQGLAAIIFIQSLSFFSLVYLNAYPWRYRVQSLSFGDITPCDAWYPGWGHSDLYSEY